MPCESSDADRSHPARTARNQAEGHPGSGAGERSASDRPEPFHANAQRVIVALFGLFLGIMLARGFHL